VGIFLACFTLTVGMTIATGGAAVLWAQFVGKGMHEDEIVGHGRRREIDIKTW
jgi:hypothetical protein